MDKYLKASGFHDLDTIRARDRLIQDVIDNPDIKKAIQIQDNRYINYYQKYFGGFFGITVVETMDPDGYKKVDSFYPFVRGINEISQKNLEFEHYTGKEGYSVICDNNNIGIPLIFHLNNMPDYLACKNREEDLSYVKLSAIALEGTVLLPMERDEHELVEERLDNELRNQMIDAAKQGDRDAMEKLTMEDMDIYTSVTTRSRKEDLFSIVTSYFMPYTVECDKYSILGDISRVQEVVNYLTGEKLYYMTVECNSLLIDILIHKDHLVGEPGDHRRFKGNIWLQGEVSSLDL